MKFPHSLNNYRICACGLEFGPSHLPQSEVGDNCPAALRVHIGELQAHVGSLAKAQASGYAAGYAAGVEAAPVRLLRA